MNAKQGRATQRANTKHIQCPRCGHKISEQEAKAKTHKEPAINLSHLPYAPKAR